jgi:hypothetical protein
MLFTDADCLTIQDLAIIDPECTGVASSEKPAIVLSGPNSIIRHTMEECGNELMAKFQNFSGYLVSPGLSLNHIAAVMNIMSTAISRPRMRLNQVVAIGPNPTKNAMKHWLEHTALRNLYRAAFARFSRNEDRYQKKLEWWDEEATRAWKQLIYQGVPVVLQPLPCPGALREFNAGTFDTTCVTAGGSGSADPGSTWNVAITWVGAAYVSPSNKNNAESAGSAVVTVNTTSGQVLTVSIANLNPPTSTLPPIGTADNIYNQVSASGWIIYCSSGNGPFYQQNSTPIPVGTTSYTLPAAPVQSGASTLQAGQFEDYNFSWANILFRA